MGNAFLTFRADELRAQQNLVVQSLNQQIGQAKQHVNSINAQFDQLASQPVSPAQQSQLGTLRAEQTSATNTLSSLQSAASSNQTTTLPALTAALKNSQVLSVTPIPYPKKKTLVTYIALGAPSGTCRGPAPSSSFEPWYPIGYADGTTSRMRSTLPSSSVSARWAHAVG